MAEASRTETSLQMPSLPPVELGEMSLQPTDADQHTSTLPSETLAEHQHTDQPSDAAVSSQGTQPPSEPLLSAESRPAQGIPPPITIPPAAITRTNTEAIGPSTDLPTPMLRSASAAVAQGPVVQFTLLLASTGTRHPYQINERYLAKRNVDAKGQGGEFDPGSISVYTLKELILKDWRDDWDAKPSSPSAIRLIFFGQLLADNASLRDCKLNTEGTPNVIHVTVKPQEAVEDDEGGKGGKSSLSRGRDRDDRTPGCRCVIL